jgi:hypothetical protein
VWGGDDEFWILVGFVAGLVVGTFKSDFFSDVLGGVVHVDKPNCQVTIGSNNDYNMTRDHCSGCEGTRWVFQSGPGDASILWRYLSPPELET